MIMKWLFIVGGAWALTCTVLMTYLFIKMMMFENHMLLIDFDAYGEARLEFVLAIVLLFPTFYYFSHSVRLKANGA